MKNHIKILHIMDGTFTHGGTPRKLLSLVVNGDHDKFRHIFLLFANSINNLNIEFIKAGAIVADVNRFQNWDIRLLWDIIKICKKYNCDVINTHFARADIYGAIAGIMAHIPVVKSVHGLAWNNSYLLKRIDSLLSPSRVYTVCNSVATKHFVVNQIGAVNTRVIYNGVPNNAVYYSTEQRVMKRNALGIPTDAFAIIHVGGMVAWRDQSVIIQAAKKCIAAGHNVYLLFVGDGPLRKALETESHELGLDRHTKFLGYRSDVVELNAMSDVFVNMAREEGFGIAVVEAMQSGLPVVLANAGSLPELIEDGLSGLLVPASDADVLASTLIKLAKNPEHAKHIGDAGRKHAENSFSIKRYVKEMENVYTEAVKSYYTS